MDKQQLKAILRKIVIKNEHLYLIIKKLQRFSSGFRFRRKIIGRNNTIINKGVWFNVKYKIIGDNNSIEVMQGAQLSDMTIYIRGNNHKLKIGENCRYASGSIYFHDHFCQVEIGGNTSIESAIFFVSESNKSIKVGEDCMFSGGIELRTSDGHSIIDLETKKRINDGKNIEIGNHVWIGAHSKILKGVTIGNNSIVGMSSTVTKNIASHSIAVGTPAKVIKNNIDWSRERI